MPVLQGAFRVAIFDEFLDSFAQIPRAQQKKVNKFIRKFRQDPTSASINYESLSSFSDSNLRTVRIDQAYRAVVLKPEQGNIYVLLWVDHHDKAEAWGKNKRISIHPATGALQVLTGDKVEPPIAAEVTPESVPLFEAIRDRELLRLGVPKDLLPTVRDITTADQLEEMQPALPPEAFEALFFLSEGEPLEDVEQAMAVTPSKDVDVTDFDTALERDATRRRFVVVDNDDALEAMLDAPLEKWRVFLHPSQRRLVYRKWNGPVRVLGGAGTGKTVVAMHRAAYLAEKVFTADQDRILFTTFTNNLAADIKANLAKLCSPRALRRIEVVHMDKWVHNLLKGAGYDYRIAYFNPDSRLSALWDKAMAHSPTGLFPPAFYRDEWEEVVQPHGCETWDDYRKAPRSGRGQRLSRQQRKQIWPVFEEYRHLLDKERLREPEDAMRDAAALLATGKIKATYRSILVDEAQDMSTIAFRLLRNAIPEERPNDLFIVGDGHQRIYRRKVVLSRAGVNIRGRAHRLRINYRTTDEIRRFAVALLEGIEVDDLDGESDTTKGYRSLMHGDPPEVHVHSSFEAEINTITAWVAQGNENRTCLVARTKALRDRYREALQENGVQSYLLKRCAAEDLSAKGLRIATMHRVKGLEFDRVIIPNLSPIFFACTRNANSPSIPNTEQSSERKDIMLLYVSMTRARKNTLLCTREQ